MSSSLLFHAQRGINKAQDIKSATMSFESDIQEKLPMTAIVGRHALFWSSDETSFERLLQSLKNANVLPFKYITPDPIFSHQPIAASNMTYHAFTRVDNDTLRSDSGDGWIKWNIDEKQTTLAVRLKYKLESPYNSTMMTFSTRSSKIHAGSSNSIRVNFNPNKPRKTETLTIWINDSISEFKLVPSNQPHLMSIYSLEQLTPDGD
ncbi:MAG: hypothetical protein HOD39_09280 [Verrucomicrobia bacterium]|nr:hypothetical protein [Verrucomicrobiota bacterium]